MTQKKRALKRVSVISGYQTIFAGPVGRKVLEDMMRTHHILSPVFSPDALEMARMEGERNVVLRILSQLKINTKELLEHIEKTNEETE